MIYNTLLVSGIQQSESVIHTYISTLIFPFYISFSYRSLQSIEYSSLYSRFLQQILISYEFWVKNLPPMQETQEMWIWSLDQEDPLDEEMGTHSSTLAWKIPWMEEPHGQRSLTGYSPKGCKELDMTEWLSTHTNFIYSIYVNPSLPIYLPPYPSFHTVWITTNCKKFWNTRPPYLPPEKYVCRSNT